MSVKNELKTKNLLEYLAYMISFSSFWFVIISFFYTTLYFHFLNVNIHIIPLTMADYLLSIKFYSIYAICLAFYMGSLALTIDIYLDENPLSFCKVCNNFKIISKDDSLGIIKKIYKYIKYVFFPILKKLLYLYIFIIFFALQSIFYAMNLNITLQNLLIITLISLLYCFIVYLTNNKFYFFTLTIIFYIIITIFNICHLAYTNAEADKQHEKQYTVEKTVENTEKTSYKILKSYENGYLVYNNGFFDFLTKDGNILINLQNKNIIKL